MNKNTYTQYYSYLKEVASADSFKNLENPDDESDKELEKLAAKLNSIEAKHIKTDGTVELVKPKNGKTFSAEELHEYVNGYFQIKNVAKWWLVLNEEGKVHNLPFNEIANWIYQGAYPHENDHIVGDVLMCRLDQME